MRHSHPFVHAASVTQQDIYKIDYSRFFTTISNQRSASKNNLEIATTHDKG